METLPPYVDTPTQGDRLNQLKRSFHQKPTPSPPPMTR